MITPAGLSGGLELVRDCIEILESDMIPEATVLGEPQLGRRGLYHDIHGKVVEDVVLMRTHVLAYADGDHTLFDIARLLGKPFKLIRDIAIELESHSLLTLRLPPGVDSHSDSQ